MVELNVVTFWGLCLLAAMGLIRAAIDVFTKTDNVEHTHWTKPAKPDAPEGMEWVLIKKRDLRKPDIDDPLN